MSREHQAFVSFFFFSRKFFAPNLPYHVVNSAEVSLIEYNPGNLSSPRTTGWMALGR
jgi:hypothetical protein